MKNETVTHTARFYLAGLILLLLAAGCRQNNAASPTAAPNSPVASAETATLPAPVSPISSPAPQPTLPESTAVAAVPTSQVFLPAVGAGATRPPATATPPAAPPTITPIPSPTPIPTVDFAAARAALQSQGQELGFVKIGFHVTFPDQNVGLGSWMQRQDEAGVPFFLKTVDNAGPLFEAQRLMRASGVPHTLVYRSNATGDLPDYNLPPANAAAIHWQRHRDAFPPELDPSLVWLETINEVDKNRADWLAEFALATAELALADGFRWAAFSWSAGEPEPEHWQRPAMLDFLRLAAANPERLAVALHEGSSTIDDIAFQYPYRTGRFLQLFEICDQNNIPRPTILITEWGWVYDDIPDVDRAIADIAWASSLYAQFPEVKGAAIWNLGIGCCFGEISAEVGALVGPLTIYALTNYFVIPQPPAQASTNADLYQR